LNLPTTSVFEVAHPAEKNGILILRRSVAAADREIDRSVYELYSRTREEIHIIEKASA